MKLLALTVLGICVCGFPIAQRNERGEDIDPWTYWTSGTTKLWGANVFQAVDAADRRTWVPLLRPHDLEDLYRAGANYVNFSVPGPFDPESGKCNADDWRHLKERVEWAKAAKLKIVISFRTAPGRNEADLTNPFTVGAKRDLLDDLVSPNVEKFCEMWRAVAKEYGNDPAVVGFDLLVEPHAPKKWEAGKYYDYKYRKSNRWREVAAKTIKAIRDQNVTTPILVEPDLWAAAIYLNQVDDPDPMGEQLVWTMPAGDRLVCAVHQYEPYKYTEDGTEEFDIDFVALREAFCAIRTWRAQNPKVPVCVNEFGVKQARPYAELFVHKELGLLKEQNLNHAVWEWQVTDPQVDYHDFDIRYNPAVYAELRANWQSNAGGPNDGGRRNLRDGGQPRPGPKSEKPRVQPVPRSGRPDPSAQGGQVKREHAANRCDCDSTLYDPALKVEVPVADARDEFHRLSDESRPGPNAIRSIAAHKTARRVRADKLAPRAKAKAAVDDGHSRSIGYWPKSDQLRFNQSTAIRHVIVFPDTVGGDFHTFLYQTSTNRSEKGTEAHIAFAHPNPPEFWVYDWSLCNNRLARHVAVSKMDKWVFPVRIGGFERKGILVVNQTRLVKDTTWINCVYLGVFENGRLQRFDAVYSNTYVLDTNDEQQPSCNGYWGPQIESFQNYAKRINEMGFTGCWMIQDGKPIALDESNTDLHDDNQGYGLTIFYKSPPLRDFLVR
jgi:hypothetical protein